jgi:hypothetical protein
LRGVQLTGILALDGPIKDNQHMTDQHFSDISRGCRHANADIGHRCRMWMHQTMDPRKWGQPDISAKKLAKAVRDADRQIAKAAKAAKVSNRNV